MTPTQFARGIVAWVKRWKTWRYYYDPKVAYNAVLAELQANPSILEAHSSRLEAGLKAEAQRIRFDLGVIAIEAAQDAEQTAQAAQQTGILVDAEWLEREAQRLMRQLEPELFLVTRLADGPVVCKTLKQEGQALGMSVARLYEARNILGVYSLIDQRRTYWTLPEAAVAA